MFSKMLILQILMWVWVTIAQTKKNDQFFYQTKYVINVPTTLFWIKVVKSGTNKRNSIALNETGEESYGPAVVLIDNDVDNSTKKLGG